MNSPTPEQVREARLNSGLTQTEAGKVIYCALRTWQAWEQGTRVMEPAKWELFLDKTRSLRKPKKPELSTPDAPPSV